MAHTEIDFELLVARRDKAVASVTALAGEVRVSTGTWTPEADWSETLARIFGAADTLLAQHARIARLEQQQREVEAAATETITSLEARLRELQQRAEDAERGRAAAEDALRRLHAALVERFGPALDVG